MIFRKSKEKEEKIKEPYTKATAITQVIMTICAIFFLAPIFIIFNYSFKTKRELSGKSPVSSGISEFGKLCKSI